MAVCRWVGGAPVVVQQTTITIANTWATSDWVQVTIGTKDLRVTVGSAFTVSDVAAALAAAINAADATTGLVGNETRSAGGQEIPAFVGLSASANLGVVTVTGLADGTPFTMTASESTAGTGTATAAVATAATGPNHLSNVDNYAAGAVPVDNDDLYFDNGAVDALYDLDYFRTNNIDLNVYITNDWTGQLGLPIVNEAGYPEYRTRYFQFRGGSKVFKVSAGYNGNVSAGNIYVDFSDQASVSIYIQAARNADASSPSIYLAGSDATTALTLLHITATSGSVSVEPDDAATGSTKYFMVNELIVGILNESAVAPVVYLGKNARLPKANDFIVNSGITYCESGTDDGVDSVNFVLAGGLLYIGGPSKQYASGSIASGATLFPVGDGGQTVTNYFTVNGGTVDCRRGVGVFPMNTLSVHKGSAIHDPLGLNIGGFDLVGCLLSDVTLNFPANRNWAHIPPVN